MNIAAITQGIAVIPELLRNTSAFVEWNFPVLIARVTADSDKLAELLGEDEDEASEPLPPWQAGRLALEITTLIRGHHEFPSGHRDAMNHAVRDVDSTQHAVDLIMALASMFAHVVSDEQIEMFSRTLVEAEARES